MHVDDIEADALANMAVRIRNELAHLCVVPYGVYMRETGSRLLRILA